MISWLMITKREANVWANGNCIFRLMSTNDCWLANHCPLSRLVPMSFLVHCNCWSTMITMMIIYWVFAIGRWQLKGLWLTDGQWPQWCICPIMIGYWLGYGEGWLRMLASVVTGCWQWWYLLWLLVRLVVSSEFFGRIGFVGPCWLSWTSCRFAIVTVCPLWKLTQTHV